ncbi:MAG: DUF169 domain-containing protein [Dehalococcoidia bacterium]|nr:DUF169 domain-containing protein [Dehalococcoidia bacterium]
MDDLEKWVKDGKDLSAAIRPRSFPLGIKLLKPGEEMPEKAHRPVKDMGIKITLCQAFTMARLYGQTIGMTRDDAVFCPGPLLWAWEEMDDEADLANFWVKDLPFFEYPEVGMKTIKALPRFEKGEIVGMVVSPLEWTRIVPDVILIYCNPAQMMRLVQGTLFKQGGVLTSSFTGLAASCAEGVIESYKNQVSRVVLPGAGDRVVAMDQDDEMIFTLPASKLDELIDGIQVRHGTLGGQRYPIPHNVRFQPAMPYGKLEREKKVKGR